MHVPRRGQQPFDDTKHHLLYQNLVFSGDSDWRQIVEVQKHHIVVGMVMSPENSHIALVGHDRPGGMSCRVCQK